MSILCYHTVQPGWESPLAVEPDEFARHCSWLARRRRVIPLGEAIPRLDRTGRLPRGLAALTFDDGFASLHAHAMPLLARYRLPWTVFVVAQTLTHQGQAVDWVDTPGSDPLVTLTVDQVLEMRDAGVDIQSHSFAHRDLTTLGFDECVRDLKDSRELLSTLLGRPVPLLAYPRGRQDEHVRRAAERAGYTHAFALPEHDPRPGPYALPRVGVYRGNGVGTLRVKAARSYLRARTDRRYPLVARAIRSARARTARAGRAVRT